MQAQVFSCYVAFVYKNKDLFAVVSCVPSNVAMLPKSIKNRLTGWIKFVCRLIQPVGCMFNIPGLEYDPETKCKSLEES